MTRGEGQGRGGEQAGKGKQGREPKGEGGPQGAGGEAPEGRKRRREREAEVYRESRAMAAAEKAERKAHFDLLERRARQEGFRIEDVPGDGHCFYHVIRKGQAQKGEVITTEEVRARCCNRLATLRGKVEGALEGGGRRT
jgi:hypothetical protein